MKNISYLIVTSFASLHVSREVHCTGPKVFNNLILEIKDITRGDLLYKMVVWGLLQMSKRRVE